MHRAILALVALAAIASFGARPAAAEPRIALVVGNAAYAKGPLKTPLADAGLVAEALNSIGFEIVEGADLNQADLRARIRDFLDKVTAAGPDAVALVYFGGYGLQFEGENYLVPVDARLDRDSDIPVDAIRLSDLVRPLAGVQARAKVVVVDGARALPFAVGAKLARGLGAMEAPPGTLIAFSAAPGTVGAEERADYGAYAKALAEMLRADGLDLGAVFMRTRVRTHASTEGAQTPWHVSALTDPIVLVSGAPAPGAQDPTQSAPAPQVVKRSPRPMRDLGQEEAYGLAIERDDLPTYVEYVQSYPRSPYARRVWAQIRARREALAWQRAVQRDTPEAYWTYLRRYPDGVYAFDARRRLHRLAARDEPPAGFAPVEFSDVPPPLPDEPTDAYGAYEPGPPLPRLIDPPPPFFVNLPPPPPPRGLRLLPIPGRIPVSPRFGGPPPPRVFVPPLGAVSPQNRPPLGARKQLGPAGVVTRNPTGGQPPGPHGARPGGTNPGGAKQLNTVTTNAPGGGQPPKRRTPAGNNAPGAVTNVAPAGGQPKKFGPTGPSGATSTAPTAIQAPKPPTAPTVRASGPPAATAQQVRPPVAAKPTVVPRQPPAGQKKCPIVNGVEKCK